VDRVLLVGGSCRIPYVQETVEEKFGRPHFVFSESKFVSEFIEKEQNNCKLNEFWKLTYTISWVVDLEKKEVHGHSGLPILMGTYLDRDRLTQSLFFNRLEYLEKIKAY